jgi:hypothetical protein
MGRRWAVQRNVFISKIELPAPFASESCVYEASQAEAEEQAQAGLAASGAGHGPG